MIKEYLIDNIKSLNETNLALSYSGGTDSNCILFSCLEIGIKPILYTYTVKGYLSPDLQISKRVAEFFKLKLYICEIPKETDSIYNDVMRMFKDGISGKVNIQCMHGHYYVAPQVKEKIILNGSGIDGIYGVYKNMVLVKKSYKWNILRQEHLNKPNDDAMIYQSELFKRYGIQVYYPYRQKNILDYLMSKSYDEINKPKNKIITIKDFQNYYDKITKIYNPRGSQQIRAGTRTLHDNLLGSKYNKWNCKSIIQFYNYLKKYD